MGAFRAVAREAQVVPSGERSQALKEEVLGAGAETAPLVRKGQPAAWPEHAVSLAQCIARVAQVRERVAHGDKIECLRPENQALGGHPHELRVLAASNVRSKACARTGLFRSPYPGRPSPPPGARPGPSRSRCRALAGPSSA